MVSSRGAWRRIFCPSSGSGGEAADLAVKLAPGGVDAVGCASNFLASVFRKSIDVIVFHHVAEVVFLTPSAEHVPGDGGAVEGAGGGDDGGLVAAVGEAARFEQGDGGGFACGDLGFAAGEAHGDGATAGTGDLGFGELVFGPGIVDVFSIGDDDDALFTETGEQAVVGAFAVEDDDEAVEERVGGELGCGGQEVGGGLEAGRWRCRPVRRRRRCARRCVGIWWQARRFGRWCRVL